MDDFQKKACAAFDMGAFNEICKAYANLAMKAFPDQISRELREAVLIEMKYLFDDMDAETALQQPR